MKKYIKVVLVAVVIGCIIAYLFYNDINEEVKALTSNDNTISLFQVGVFKDYDNAINCANSYSSSLLYKDDEYYRVIIAISYSSEVTNKLQDLYTSLEVEYYVKEIKISNSFINEINTYEEVLLKTDNIEVINNINNSILDIFESYL